MIPSPNIKGQANTHNQGFTLLLLIIGLAILLALFSWQFTKNTNRPGGQAQNLLQTEQKTKQDINHINTQMLEQHSSTELLTQ